jgi:hypothetical protein
LADGQVLKKSNGRPKVEVYAEAKDPATGNLYGGSNKTVRSQMNDPTRGNLDNFPKLPSGVIINLYNDFVLNKKTSLV